MFYVLSSHNIYALKRQFKTLPIEETTVILNSLDTSFLEEAEAYCKSIDVRYFITESDGTAATGKNSYLDIFDKDGISHAVLIDGDDFLTPRGVIVYKKLAAMENPPDAVALFNQVSICFPGTSSSDRLKDNSRCSKDPATMTLQLKQPSTIVDWDAFTAGGVVENMDVDKESFCEYAKLLEYGMGLDEIATRIAFMSRKVIPFRFKPLVVGEDTLQYLELKDAFDKGNLNLVAYDETIPTYMYDLRISGIAVEESHKDDGLGFIRWMEILKTRIQELKDSGRLSNSRLPILEI